VVAVLRGGVLEPEPQTLLVEKRRLKQTLIASVYFRRANAEGLSLSGGASIRSRASSSWASPLVPTLTDRLRTQKRRPRWVALVWLAMRLGI